MVVLALVELQFVVGTFLHIHLMLETSLVALAFLGMKCFDLQEEAYVVSLLEKADLAPFLVLLVEAPSD